MSIQRVVLSGSTNGRPFPVNAIAASCGLTAHTAGSVTGADNADELWVWAVPYATSTASKGLFLQVGTTSTADMREVFIARDPADPKLPIVLPGIGINNGLKLTVWASASGDFALVGHAFQVRA